MTIKEGAYDCFSTILASFEAASIRPAGAGRETHFHRDPDWQRTQCPVGNVDIQGVPK